MYVHLIIHLKIQAWSFSKHDADSLIAKKVMRGNMYAVGKRGIDGLKMLRRT